VTVSGFGNAFQRYEGAGQTALVDVAAAHAILRGVSPADVSAVYGISVRTAYRWRRELVAIESVRVDGWVATFARRRNLPPVRMTAWEVA